MDPLRLLLYFVLVIPSAIIHEYAHGIAADSLGDPTARYAGRLTLNPFAHIDPIGTILLPIVLAMASGGAFMFAYAKPVPFNPYNLKYPKWGPAIVGVAGPFANLLLAIIFGVLLRIIGGENPISIGLSLVVLVNVLLAVFNLVPIPPLDGSKLLFAFLPRSMEHIQRSTEQFGIILFIFFIFFASHIISPLVWFLYNLITGGL